MKSVSALFLVVLATPALAEGTRQLGSHEHGVGTLNIAVDGATVAMELVAPGADIVGFEYEAKSAEDRASVEAALAVLSEPLALFALPAAAACSVVQASAELESEAEHDEHHDDHDDDHGDDHDHDHGHDDDAHSAHAEDAGHSEFHAEYVLSCGNINALSEITFAYFDAFEDARELEVQIVSASGAQAFEVRKESPSLDLDGLF